MHERVDQWHSHFQLKLWYEDITYIKKYGMQQWMELSFLAKEKLVTPFAIAIKKVTPTGNVIVGHTSRVILSVCLIFICQGGTIVCVVNGAKQYSSNLPQGGLEVRSVYFDFSSIQREGR